MIALVKTRGAVFVGVVITLAVLNVAFGLGWPSPEVSAGSTLPPRQTPTPSHPSDDDDDNDPPPGAHIELLAAAVPAGAWAVVQWQDSDGNWHDVVGWRGQLHNGFQRWWVAAKDFNTGPFRWVIQQGSNGQMTAASSPFLLPSGAGQRVQVVVGN